MEERLSPLLRIMRKEGFKPFSGPDAIRVYNKAKARINVEKIEDNILLNAVSSLGALLETEIALMYALQDQMCTRCGNCCTNNTSMRVQKHELKQIAKYRKTSYKQLKKQIRAKPGKDGTMRITRSPCPFYEDGLCAVYPARPSVCRGYPTNVLLAAMGGKLPYPTSCEISDELLAEVAIKRSIEEKMYRENPELLKELSEKKRRELQRIMGLTQSQRLAYLIKRYKNHLT